ncbi:16S rRNA (guanine(527)-N(7))-methyltransferase RsmG [Bifidobacterium choloepi]|uniref:Ribosomal RNA small subunit methyltransferase G n=1 Tax=Bifidobacterium choloepi TaxID=2614131 RepID=A0A6I5N086_9BIFI|nr:16S rRNA (guanine(527)-N(7))-methyltransferase RsmG [Bifidobacterium choloepi]NEG69977.1 16S rRNA (guanine(527)-N(7))-methyltransferase RsmG [Bifidobacterium choloepi]
MTEAETRLEGELRDELEGAPVLEEVLGAAMPQLEVFHAKLLEEGEPRGLIGPRDVSILWERHILNSAAVVPFIRKAVAKKQFKTVADLGSGGGFPGLVAAAMLPEVSFTLIEPMERRCEWLDECIEEMNLNNAVVVRARSEEAIEALKRNGRLVGKAPKTGGAVAVSAETAAAIHHPFAVVTCRAVAPMTKLAGWTLPLLASKGELIALKGRSAQAELDKARKQIAAMGGGHARVVEAPVAPGLEPTHVVILQKK